jgi:hypothetical protein
MPLTTDTKKVMFEIYRDSDFNGKFKVVYFTELGEHDKEKEIEDAMRGEHIFDGYLRNHNKQEGKRIVTEILERLNAGQRLSPSDMERELKPFMA